MPSKLNDKCNWNCDIKGRKKEKNYLDDEQKFSFFFVTCRGTIEEKKISGTILVKTPHDDTSKIV